MSKMKKLINNPSLFFRDYLNKRVNANTKNNGRNSVTVQKKVLPSTVAVKKIAPKPSGLIAPLKALTATINLETTHLNRFKKYKYYLHNGENMTAGPNHLNMWLPLLISFRVPFLLIIRDHKLYGWVLKNYPTVDVAFAKSAGDVGEVVAMTEGVPLALYSSSTGNNIHLIRFEEIKHCFIGHGDSEKAASAHKALRMFDEIWVASQAHIDRFHNKPFNTSGLDFLKIGRPTLVNALKQSGTPWYERGETKILYLPTWEGSNYKNDYSSVRTAKQILEMASGKAVIHAKLHPLTGSRDKSISNAQELIKSSFRDNVNVSVIPSSITLLDIYDKYNIFICDISSVVTECLALDVPIFLYYPKNVEIEMAVSNMVFEDYCYVFSSLEELEALIARVITGDDYKKEARQKAVDYFIGVKETKDIKLLEVLSV
ncbi:MAG: CDP-glycerol glycerophosphotransferase family protein [Comamonas sp.]|jgi:hypothetical protein|uniref:CDP-glycerol glycerophosphotransferase family protein n=1 Tax=Comamonas sp. TaxID=34028 RepID=UPI00283577B4|nr:CDP-glycerol glycerophosphotransferase family protein [Comamonas sp.]MDR0215258.1 CDP-glycerol glycerophosphotransferase family protein [Comamonas sp.]